MPNRRLLLTGVFVAVVVVGLAIAWLVDQSEPVETAPDFTVELLAGGDFSLAAHLENDGRPLIMNLWASWCAPCRAEMPFISEYAQANPDRAVIGVAVEDRIEDSQAFAAEIGVVFPLAFGDEGFRADYPSIGLPATYFINPDGSIASVFNGIVDEEVLDAGFD